jgi:excisionase family DNA binding protein
MPGAGDLTLQEAADRLGVHYMTAYRYVRTGRLPARRVASGWRVAASDVAAVAASGEAGAHERASASRGRRGGGAPVERLVTSLVRGDDNGVWAIVQSALDGVDPEGLYLTLLAPAMSQVGEHWRRGDITVAQEHLAAATLSRSVGRLGPLFNRRGRTRGTVVLGAPAGDHHALPPVLFGDLLRGRRIAVAQLGADTPSASFVETASSADRLIGVGISATISGNDAAIGETVAALHEAGIDPVVVGGRGVSRKRATALGADGWAADGASGLELFDELAGQRTRRELRS